MREMHGVQMKGMEAEKDTHFAGARKCPSRLP